MNYLVSGLLMILVMVQIYQYHETMKQRYHALFPQVQKYLMLLGVFFVCSTLLPAQWFHEWLILMILASCLIYRQEHGLKDGILLLAVYAAAFGVWKIFSIYMGGFSFWGIPVFYDDLFVIGCAYLFQVMICYRRNHSFDQMYIFPAMTGLFCYLVVIVIIAHNKLVASSGFVIILTLLLMMMGSFYRICYCMEVSRRKQILAQDKAYTMMENKDRYEAIQKENDFIMKNMHDLKKHLELLNQMDHNDSELEDYRKKIQKKTQELLHYQKTGDVLIDKILQLYHPKFLSAKIQCNIESEDIDYGYLDAVDLCAVLCNLLDNAYESCIKCDSPFILLKMRVVSDKIIWKMKNSTKEMVLHHTSSKEDGFAHGYGLQNMKQIAKKYHGELISEIDKEHGIYTTAISFSMTEDAQNMTTSAEERESVNTSVKIE